MLESKCRSYLASARSVRQARAALAAALSHPQLPDADFDVIHAALTAMTPSMQRLAGTVDTARGTIDNLVVAAPPGLVGHDLNDYLAISMAPLLDQIQGAIDGMDTHRATLSGLQAQYAAYLSTPAHQP
jgi:hypothetical protein